MTIAKVEVERFSLTCSKPFDAVVAALKSAVGQPDMVEFFKATRAANSFPDLERVVQSGLGRTGLMLFAEFDLGAILRRETGSRHSKSMRFLVGNPLIMKEMVKHVPDAGSYAPVTSFLMNVPMACMSPMTKWRVICCPMAAWTLLPSPAILMRKSPPCYANAQANFLCQQMPQSAFGYLALRSAGEISTPKRSHQMMTLGYFARSMPAGMA